MLTIKSELFKDYHTGLVKKLGGYSGRLCYQVMDSCTVQVRFFNIWEEADVAALSGEMGRLRAQYAVEHGDEIPPVTIDYEGTVPGWHLHTGTYRVEHIDLTLVVSKRQSDDGRYQMLSAQGTLPHIMSFVGFVNEVVNKKFVENKEQGKYYTPDRNHNVISLFG